MRSNKTDLYGILAEFERSDALLAGIAAARQAGYRRLEAYSPFPLEGLSEAMGFETDRVPLITLIGGIVGGLTGFIMQWYANVIDYPINVGGRPLYSWPAFIPVTFELTILGAALSAVLGMLALNRLPELYHPVFTQDNFERASKDRYFLCIRSADSRFDRALTREFLAKLAPLVVSEVPHEP